MTGMDQAGRWLRVVALAVISTVLAATAHAVAAGDSLAGLVAATPAAVLGSAGVLSAAAIGGLGWQGRPWWLVAALLTVVQLGQHLVLTASAARAGGHGAGHGHASAGHGALPMLTAHLTAATITAVLLRYAERAVRLLGSWLSWPLLRVRPWRPMHLVPLQASCPPVWCPASTSPLRGGLGLRGPPGLSALR